MGPSLAAPEGFSGGLVNTPRFPRGRSWDLLSFSTLFQFQNNRPIARTRMKGRLLPNLEVHRSLQAPNSGCRRNPETEQASGHCRGPRGTLGQRETASWGAQNTCAHKSPGMGSRAMGLGASNETLSYEPRDKQTLLLPGLHLGPRGLYAATTSLGSPRDSRASRRKPHGALLLRSSSAHSA